MNYILFVSILAPIFNCIQVIPQLWKTYQTKKVKDLSFTTILLMITTNLLWFLHGNFIYDIPLIISLMSLYVKYNK